MVRRRRTSSMQRYFFVLSWGRALSNVSGASNSKLMLSLGVLSELDQLQLYIQCMTFANFFV